MDAVAISVLSVDAPNFKKPALHDIHGHQLFPPDKQATPEPAQGRVSKLRRDGGDGPITVAEIRSVQRSMKQQLLRQLASTESGQNAIVRATTVAPATETQVPLALHVARTVQPPATSSSAVESDVLAAEGMDFL